MRWRSQRSALFLPAADQSDIDQASCKLQSISSEILYFLIICLTRGVNWVRSAKIDSCVYFMKFFLLFRKYFLFFLSSRFFVANGGQVRPPDPIDFDARQRAAEGPRTGVRGGGCPKQSETLKACRRITSINLA